MYRKSDFKIVLFAFMVLMTLTVSIASAAPVTQKITYQGKLTDAQGDPLTGTYSVTFTIYNIDGTVFSTETHDVTVTDGLFTTPVAITSPAGLDGRSLWLGIKVGSDAEMTPRQEIRPVPYAMSLKPGALIKNNDAKEVLDLRSNFDGEWAGYALKVMTTGSTNFGVFVQTDGSHSLGIDIQTINTSSDGLRVYTFGNESYGENVLTFGDYGNGVNVSTKGHHAHGVNVGTAGKYSRGVIAQTSGDYADGLYSSTLGEYAEGVEAFTSGDNSRGVNVSTAGAHSHGVNISTTGWDSWGAYAMTRGDDSHGFVSNVWGDNSNGVYTFTHGASSSGVRANTFGTESDGVTAFTANTGSNAFSGVTSGDYGYGVDILTSGNYSRGVNITTSNHHAHGVNVETTGKYSRGVIAQTSGDYADGLHSSTNGQYAEGVEAFTSGDHSNGVNVTTEGTDSHGVHIETSGSYSNGEAVETSGSYSNGVYALASGVGAYGVYASSTQSNGIYANTGNTNHQWGVYTPDYIYAGGIRAPDVDLAEFMPVMGDLSPGTVLIIGPDGRLQMASAANDTRVAGIISTSPAIALGTKAEGNTGEAVVAISGRVPCRVDAGYGAVHPGDLLSTSDTPGYAMKAKPVQIDGIEFYRDGTVLGKAMGTLESGTGTIEVLVTLQ